MTRIDMIADMISIGPLCDGVLTLWGWEAHSALMEALMRSDIPMGEEVHFFARPVRDGYEFDVTKAWSDAWK